MTIVTDTCPFCPRLCRHVCPVVAATARESATPTAIATVIRLAQQGKLTSELAESALSLCNGCGACARHCGVGMDVAATVRECRSRPTPAPLPALPADSRPVRVRVGEGEASGTVVHTPDSLGHAAVLAGDLAHVKRVGRHFGGRGVLTDSNAVAAVLLAASALPGIAPITVVMDVPPLGGARFMTCWEGATGADGQVACCGAREGFETANPSVASAMAQEAVRRMGGEPTVCADGHCAAWLRVHGGVVEGPHADVSS